MTAQQLGGSARVADFSRMGESWHVRLHDASDVDALSAELGVPVHAIRPSLEDVFLDAIQRGRP